MPPGSPLLLLAAVLALAGLGTSEAANLWKWRDASGRLTVSDQPPPREVPERDIVERPASVGRATQSVAPAAPVAAPAAASVAAAAPRVDAELEARRRAQALQARAAASAPSSDDARRDAQRRENCARARTMLATLESGQRMARLNDKGERVVLDDAQRAQDVRRAREIIAAECT
jgi:hypothetical protein